MSANKEEEQRIISVFVERLQTLRNQKGFSIRKLGEASNIAYSQISLYLKGERLPNVVSLAHLAKALGVSTDYLVGVSDTIDKTESS